MTKSNNKIVHHPVLNKDPRKRDHVHVVITGGTIDSFMDRSGDVKTSMKSNVRQYIEEVIQPHFTLSEEIVSLVDSREITDKIRKKIFDVISSSQNSQFLITHGTYTLTKTADYLQARIDDLKERTIVLTGSFFPLKQFIDTDATFNLGYAIAALQILPAGIYVAMNGSVFSPGTVKKDLKETRFVLNKVAKG